VDETVTEEVEAAKGEDIHRSIGPTFDLVSGGLVDSKDGLLVRPDDPGNSAGSGRSLGILCGQHVQILESRAGVE